MNVEFKDHGAQPTKRLAAIKPDDDLVFRSHLRLAYRFEEAYSSEFMFVNGIGWYLWDGMRWAESKKGEVERALFAMLREAWPDAMGDPTLQADIRSAQTSSGTAGVLSQASKLESFARVASDLDQDPYMLNTPSGTADLRTFELRKHDPHDRITKLTRGSFDLTALAPRWDRTVQHILPDPEVRSFLQRYVGTALVGKVLEHKLLILMGPGGNGKGTFYEAVSFTLGDYAMSAEPELFMHKEGAHPTGQMDLMSKRWVVTSETDQNRKLASATVKRLTGGDMIRARKMHKDFVEFPPSHSAVMVTNHLPRVSGSDAALWRRIRVVPFQVIIPEDQQEGNLDEYLHLEADGILAWALRGWVDYTQRGYSLAEPASVERATSEYQSDSDDIARFIEECCTFGPGLRITQKSLRLRWETWRHYEDGAPTLSARAFARELTNKGYITSRGAANIAYFEGIDIVT